MVHNHEVPSSILGLATRLRSTCIGLRVLFYPITTPSEGVAARPVFPTPLEGVELAHRRYRDCGAVCRENAAATPSEGVAERPVFLTPSEGVGSACLRYCRSGGI